MTKAKNLIASSVLALPAVLLGWAASAQADCLNLPCGYSSPTCCANATCNGQKCKYNTGVSCGGDSDCLTGYCPNNTSCSNTKSCQANTDCPEGQTCLNKLWCKISTGVPCSEDSDCITNSCADAGTHISACVCAEFGRCNSNVDCCPNQVCDTMLNQCKTATNQQPCNGNPQCASFNCDTVHNTCKCDNANQGHCLSSTDCCPNKGYSCVMGQCK
jgi:hypothetical protein